MKKLLLLFLFVGLVGCATTSLSTAKEKHGGERAGR